MKLKYLAIGILAGIASAYLYEKYQANK